MMKVKIVGWNPGLLTISLMNLLREQAGYSLKAAKRAVDDLLDDVPTTVEFPSDASAKKFLDAAVQLGAKARLE